MTRQIGPIVEILMQRVRQSGGLAVSENQAVSIYSLCEQITNLSTKRVTESSTVTIPKEKLIFPFRVLLPNAIGIKRITESGREILRARSINDLSSYDIGWFRSISGTRFESWTQIGFDLLVLYPGSAAATTVDIEYVKLLTHHTDFAASYNIDSELPSEDVEIALSLAEIILLKRFRLLTTIKSKFTELKKLLLQRGIKI
jgi:hypothetical protein